ncbi:hypothetical protein GQ55_8G139200 [Panicum hallii var. hallii]|uniref:Uncharacterized protein n=1 Tax=Panicum hallii var. hallii TaxID=1504633 RepID=A0A2T7CN24_9POAL|nr:hypothetical protein GQ55_8G139200 [Panicum hallii var. hallii]
MCLCVVLIRILLFTYFATALLQFACSDCGLSAAIYAFAYDGRDTFSLSEYELFQFLEDYKFPASQICRAVGFVKWLLGTMLVQRVGNPVEWQDLVKYGDSIHRTSRI